MTATITDINEYRRSKVDVEDYFQFHEDEDILRRIEILTWVDGGWGAPGTLEHSLVFPKGFDPVGHPEDNKDVVLAEATRRGII